MKKTYKFKTYKMKLKYSREIKIWYRLYPK